MSVKSNYFWNKGLEVALLYALVHRSPVWLLHSAWGGEKFGWNKWRQSSLTQTLSLPRLWLMFSVMVYQNSVRGSCTGSPSLWLLSPWSTFRLECIFYPCVVFTDRHWAFGSLSYGDLPNVEFSYPISKKSYSLNTSHVVREVFKYWEAVKLGGRYTFTKIPIFTQKIEF